MRCARPRGFASVTTADPSCTGVTSTRRQPYATAAPAVYGAKSSQGAGALSAASVGGAEAVSASRSPPRASPSPAPAASSVGSRSGRVAATAVPTAPTANAAAAPTAALAIKSRRESIARSFLDLDVASHDTGRVGPLSGSRGNAGDRDSGTLPLSRKNALAAVGNRNSRRHAEAGTARTAGPRGGSAAP